VTVFFHLLTFLVILVLFVLLSIVCTVVKFYNDGVVHAGGKIRLSHLDRISFLSLSLT